MNDDLLARIRALAKEYRSRTGRPLGVTGEVAEHAACALLGLERAPVRQAGYDALDPNTGRRIQVKSRCLQPGKRLAGQRIGGIDLSKPFDDVVLVVLDEDLEVVAIYRATREAIEAALLAPGSRARNERGAMHISKFKAIGEQIV